MEYLQLTLPLVPLPTLPSSCSVCRVSFPIIVWVHPKPHLQDEETTVVLTTSRQTQKHTLDDCTYLKVQSQVWWRIKETGNRKKEGLGAGTRGLWNTANAHTSSGADTVNGFSVHLSYTVKKANSEVLWRKHTSYQQAGSSSAQHCSFYPNVKDIA